MTALMDETTLAGIELRAGQVEANLVALGWVNPGKTDQAVHLARTDVPALVDEVRRLSAALADANKTIRALVAAAPSGEPNHTEEDR